MRHHKLCISKLVLNRAFRLGLSTALLVPTSFSVSVLLATNTWAACSPASGVVANPGTVLCLDDTLNQDPLRGYGTGAEDNVTLTVQQDATVTGDHNGLWLGDGASITNLGAITGTTSYALRTGTGASITNLGAIEGLGGGGVEAEDITSLTNSGTIKGDYSGVYGGFITMLTNTRSGTIEGDSYGIYSEYDDFGSLINYGNVMGSRFSGIYHEGGDFISLLNFGSMEGGDRGMEIYGDIVSLVNYGTIEGGDFGMEIDGDIVSLINYGTIRSSDAGSNNHGISADEISNLVNAGTIQGSDHAIRETNIGDTQLTLKAGSILIGAVDLGGGANTLNIGEGLSLNSVFDSDGGASLLAIGATSGAFVATQTQVDDGTLGAGETRVVTVDKSAFSGTGDAMAALTSGIGGAVQSRQAAVRSDPALSFSSNFASRYAAAEESSPAAFADFNLDAAPQMNPNRVWIEGFGAYRQDRGDRGGTDFDSLIGGLVAGFDVPLDGISSVGVLAGFAASTTQNETNTQDTNAISYYGGVYASTQAHGVAWDASLTLGYTDYDADRTTANNALPGGLETANADFGGWFINPQLTMTRQAANPLAGSALGALMATNTLEQMLTLSYTGLFLDGYTETGTTSPLTLNDRDVHLASARAALALPFEAIHEDGAQTTVRLVGGVEARTQFGDDTVSGTLLGQAVSTTVADDDFTAGAFVGLSSEYATANGMTAYANAEGLIETDAAWQVSATAGLRIAF